MHISFQKEIASSNLHMVKVLISGILLQGCRERKSMRIADFQVLWNLVLKIDYKGFSYIVFFFSCTNRIIAMCGDYYIGGRRFSSLSDLIGYYSHVSCLLKGEKLLYPVAPPEASKMSFKTLLFHFTSRISCCSVSHDVYN